MSKSAFSSLLTRALLEESARKQKLLLLRMVSVVALRLLALVASIFVCLPFAATLQC